MRRSINCHHCGKKIILSTRADSIGMVVILLLLMIGVIYAYYVGYRFEDLQKYISEIKFGK